MKSKPLVSINIRTYNSASTLAETLESVNNQDYSNIEVIISDGYSSDTTVEIAKKYGAVITYSKLLGDARYKVFSKSKGEYVISLDSDQVMDNNLIRLCVERCQRYNLDALIISEKSFVTHNTFLEKLITYDKYLIDKDRKGTSVFDIASPRFFKGNILLSVNWPKKLSIFDDTILTAMLIKMGAKIDYINKASIWHHEVGSWKIFIKKFFRYGKGYFRAFNVSPGVVSVHSLPRRSYFTKYIFEKPIYILPIFLLYFIKVLAASAGAMVSIIENITAGFKDGKIKQI